VARSRDSIISTSSSPAQLGPLSPRKFCFIKNIKEPFFRLVLTGVLQKIIKDENMGIFRALIGLVFGLFFHIPEIKKYFSVPEKEVSDNLNNDIKNLPLFTKSGDKFIDYQVEPHFFYVFNLFSVNFTGSECKKTSN
jgi:hypothetical protein